MKDIEKIREEIIDCLEKREKVRRDSEAYNFLTSRIFALDWVAPEISLRSLKDSIN